MTKDHHPLEFNVISYNEDAYGAVAGKKIYVGTFEQCDERIREIANLFPHYAKNLKIEKCNDLH